MIAIDQDKAGKQAKRVSKAGDQEIWVRELAGGDHAVAVFNLGTDPSTATVHWTDLGLKKPPSRIRDLWNHTDDKGRGILGDDSRARRGDVADSLLSCPGDYVNARTLTGAHREGFMRLFGAALLSSLICAPAYGQQLPDAESLMKQVADAAKHYHSLQFVSENTSETASGGGQPFKVVSKVTETHVTPGKSRIESSTAGMTVLVVSNSEFTYVYSSLKKEYVKIPAGLGPAGMMSAMGMKMPDLDSVHQSYKTLRDETLEIDGVKHDCWVLEDNIGEMAVPLPQSDQPPAKATGVAMTMWVDKKLLITMQTLMSMKMELPNMPDPNMKTMEMHQTIVVKNLKIDQPVDESLFTFTPPEGAKEVKELSFASAALPKADLAGKDAPAFEIRGLDGKLYTSTALRGKTVLLDFWATWCVPCRQSMPSVEKIYAEYKDRGLVALAVDTGEELEVVEGFVKKIPFAYPVALSGESEILHAYKVTAYPTFVLIGPDGKVIAHEIGFGGEQMLRKMIGKAAFVSNQPRP